ncbi:MAG: MFS transporter [Alphaproteobacteria bacterium]|nr:MFS transporter [Alphaproteobacteria bacterium]
MPPKPLSLPQLGAVVAGNALEFYDFLTFSFFAVQIGQVFFPGKDTTSSLLFTLATFGVGFATRPLGGVVIGTLGDTWGRKPAMLFSFGLMGASVVGLALTPSFARIGWYAPLMAVLFRLLQGFALGGEVGPTTAFLLEVAPPDRRGFYVSLQNATQYLATLCAGLVGLILASILSPQQLTDFGWRIALLIGAAVVPFALAIRRRLPETLHDVRVRPGKGGRLGGLLWLGVLGLCMLASATIGTYTMNYMTTFANHTLGFPAGWAFAATIAVGAAAMSGALLAGLISDKVGRKPVMIGASLAQLGLVVPCFTIMVHYHSLSVLLAGTGLMALFVGMCAAGAVISLTESLPVNLRAGSLGIIYALSIASFGGTAQFIVTWLIDVTGSPLAPAWYLTGAVLLGLIAMLMMRESAPLKRR